jgi:hypothetical protein
MQNPASAALVQCRICANVAAISPKPLIALDSHGMAQRVLTLGAPLIKKRHAQESDETHHRDH